MPTDNTLVKIKATADILGGDVFFATDTGVDPEYPSNGDLLANGMYIRLNGSDGSVAYISAFELDKALSIIGDMSMTKASAADLQALTAIVNEKASKTDLDLLKADVDANATQSEVDDLWTLARSKADQATIDEIIEVLNAKANQSLVDELSTAINAKANQSLVDELTTTVNAKANQSELAAMLTDVRALQETVQLLTNTDSINAINNQIAYLNSEIVRRLTIDDLGTINTNIATLTENNEVLSTRMDNVEVNLNKKATSTYVQGQVSELNTAITSLAARVDNKSDKTDLQYKADKTDFDNVVRKVNSMQSSLNELDADVDSNYNELLGKVNSKAEKTYVDTKVVEFTDNINSKADRSSLNDAVAQLNNKINTLETNHANLISGVAADIEEVECDVDAAILEMRAAINTQNKTITSQTSEISKLKSSTEGYGNQLKQTWVRVLTTNEYKKLINNPPEGVYNQRYKYPNTVYLVVDFNKPKAIYIGDILVAQAEQKGSIGFAYTFPIVF
jgi:hypothetical protein